METVQWDNNASNRRRRKVKQRIAERNGIGPRGGDSEKTRGVNRPVANGTFPIYVAG